MLTTISIAGKEYPMSFSVMAAKKIAAEYGSIEKILDKVQAEEGVTEEALETIIYILELLIAQGCAYKNYFEKDVPPPKDAPIIDGKWAPLPREALEIAAEIADLEEFAQKIEECMNKGKKKTIGADSKNAKAGRE